MKSWTGDEMTQDWMLNAQGRIERPTPIEWLGDRMGDDREHVAVRLVGLLIFAAAAVVIGLAALRWAMHS